MRHDARRNAATPQLADDVAALIGAVSKVAVEAGVEIEHAPDHDCSSDVFTLADTGEGGYRHAIGMARHGGSEWDIMVRGGSASADEPAAENVDRAIASVR